MADPLKLFGTREDAAPARRLRAGPLSVDLVAGNLRTIAFGGVEVLRAVSYVVRDRDWGTYAPPIRELEVEEEAGRFRVGYRAEVTAPDGARLTIAAAIEGHADGTLRFTVDATPDRSFETNRCGFCVLHPIEGVAGTPVTVEHTDGQVENALFPDLIEPWQPFQDMREIRHEAAPGLHAACRLEGDAFEMEDQRAWSDASYKTYVRPLAWPWPYRMDAGRTDRQSVALSIQAEAPVVIPSAAANGPVRIEIGAPLPQPVPRFGLAVAPEDLDAVLAQPERLAALVPPLLLFHFDPTAGHDRAALDGFARVAAFLSQAEHALELVLPGREAPEVEMAHLARLIDASPFRPRTLVVGPSVDRQSTPPGSRWPDCPPLEDVYRAARAAFPDVVLGGGMFSYFTELNRKRVPLGTIDFVTHATCPIVHAADDLSVMQTLEAIPFITRSTRSFIGSTPYRLGPTTIGMRQNPYGSRTMPNPRGGRVPMAADDPRARGLFGAAFLVGYAARLAGADIEAWTGASLAGPRGLMEGGGVTPAFHVAKGLAALSGAQRLALGSREPGKVDGFAARRSNGQCEIWLANLTAEPQTVSLEALGADLAVSFLDEAAFDGAAGGEMPPSRQAMERSVLAPYAVARIVAGPQAP